MTSAASMLPPPVPTSKMSIIGIWMGSAFSYPPISALPVVKGLLSLMTPAFAVVPRRGARRPIP